MTLNDDQARAMPGQPGDPSPERPAGLLEKLVAAVRPEFRVDVLIIDPGDPVFGGRPCGVEGCGRAARLHGLCEGHYQRWHDQGRPATGEFTTATSARMRGNTPMQPCLAPGCGYGRNSTGLCVAHIRAWRSSGQPELRRWLDTLPWAEITAPHGLCRVPSCALWSTARTPLCVSHAARWRKTGRPDVAEFARAYDDTPLIHDHIDLLLLEPHLRMEMQYILQQRRDEQQVQIQPKLIQHAIYVLARTGMCSLLEWPEGRWQDQILTGPGADQPARPFLTYARRRIEHLHFGSGWEIEYPRDVWRLRNLGLDGGSQANLRFGRIGQPWLKDLAKRWSRWRLSSGLSINHACTGVTAIARFSQFLTQSDVAAEHLGQVDRKVLESYLAQLHAQMGATEHHKRLISLLSTFFTDIRRHRWDLSLPADAVFFPEDFPKQPKRLPRALAEHVMAQVEDPGNLDRWGNRAYRLITVILMRCGLRITDTVRLAADCTVHDRDGAPYLRYYNHKMKREALVPIDEELERDIGRQRSRDQDRWPGGTPVLFPRATANLAGGKPLAAGTYRWALDRWLERCDVRDEHGQPVHLTPHQWRHTLGTRLINRDVPQEVVRRILDHDSHEMTAHYARLHDTTIRRHWEQARKVNTSGETVTLDPGGPLAEAAWAKQRVGRATQALPNGYCGLPVQRTCPHANACLTCPTFITTAEFLPQHRTQRQQTLQIITAAGTRGQTRLAEMNQQVADNLEKIITALEIDDPGHHEVAADAS
jgi:site-specific recombinase XerD